MHFQCIFELLAYCPVLVNFDHTARGARIKTIPYELYWASVYSFVLIPGLGYTLFEKVRCCRDIRKQGILGKSCLGGHVCVCSRLSVTAEKIKGAGVRGYGVGVKGGLFSFLDVTCRSGSFCLWKGLVQCITGRFIGIGCDTSNGVVVFNTLCVLRKNYGDGADRPVEIFWDIIVVL